MLIRYYIFALLILFTTPTPVPTTVPPTPDEIFAEGVKYEVLTYDYGGNTGAEWDNEARNLIYQGKTFSYPEQIAHIYDIYTTDDPQLLSMNVLEVQAETDRSDHYWVWLFDLTTKTFSRYEAHCGETFPLHTSQLQKRRIFFTQPDSNEIYLCEPATGDLSEPLPAGYEWGILEFWGDNPAVLDTWDSPDNRWVLFFGKETAILPEIKMHAFSYELATGTLLDLGYFQTDGFTGVYAWHGSLVTFYYDLMGIDGGYHDKNTLYVVDAAQVDSLEVMIEDTIFSYDLPEKDRQMSYYLPKEGDTLYNFVTINMPDYRNWWQGECEYVVYDVTTHQTRTYPMGSLCRPEAGVVDGTAYYRDVTQGAEGIATLYRFNVLSGEREALLTGEIEQIVRISADGQYATLVLDDDGWIDAYTLQAPIRWSRASHPRLVYFDMETKTILLDIPTDWRTFDCDACGGPNSLNEGAGDMGSSGDIWVLDDGRLAALGNEGVCEEVPGGFDEFNCTSLPYLSFFKLAGSSYREQRVLDHVDRKLTDDLILFSPAGTGSTAKSVYKISTGEIIPLINDWNIEGYELRSWVADYDGQFALYLNFESVTTYATIYHFRIMLDDIR